MGSCNPGIAAALGAALLFGCGAPFSKLLMGESSPWLLAGLLYLGSGIGVTLYRLVTIKTSTRLDKTEWGWLVGAIISGGVIAPVLLMLGLSGMPGSGASLLLNIEGVFTTIIAWFVFRENLDIRVVAGMVLILLGAVATSWPGEAEFSSILPAMCIIGSCLAWAVDNNLTCKVSHADATWIASTKGFAAGSVNVCLAMALEAKWPSAGQIGGMLLLGCLSYGASLALFVVGLRHLGTARAGAYFSVAPFFGAALSLPLLGESFDVRLALSGLLMAGGVVLHLTESHAHAHTHLETAHEHYHAHDDNHGHSHAEVCNPSAVHGHWHCHMAVTHSHEHYPDADHKHPH